VPEAPVRAHRGLLETRRPLCELTPDPRCDAHGGRVYRPLALTSYGAPEPDRHRRREVRDDEPARVPRPASGGRDVAGEGARLLRRGEALGPGSRVVRSAVRGRSGARRVVAELYGVPALSRRTGAHPPRR